MANGKPTLRDVAAEAGVSPMTASNALHGKAGVKESTRAKVLAAAKKLDYRINLTASMLKSGRSNIIHIIINEFDSPFYSKLTQTLSREITSRGLTPLSLASGRFVPNPVACRISPSKSCPENGLLVSACSAASGEYWVCSMNGVSPREVISRLNVCVSFE